ncbi:MAG TPA: hypothetical protein EYP33_07320, partial [Pyrodictium sp.]|nr:hypothetical protein [Pyrodictium sp.]
KVLEIILKEGDVNKAINYVQDIIEKVKKHLIPVEKMVIHEQLRKNLEEYKSEGPHVIAAKKMKKKGIPVSAGTVVRYVICKGGGRIKDKVKLPEECRNKEYDPEYYIEHQIIPAIERIFSSIGITKERLKSSKQTSLTSFFK